MSLFGIGEVSNLIQTVIGKVIPDKGEATKLALEIQKLEQTGELALLAAETDIMKGQLEVNKVEAASEHLFVSGWRPFIGWVCGSAFAYNYVLQPFFIFAVMVCGVNIVPPTLDTAVLMTLLSAMLGLGGMRSFDKAKKLGK
jgi:Holin of 3TMs, for gene-transfer release